MAYTVRKRVFGPSVKNKKSYGRYLELVSSHRTPSGPRQKFIRYIGKEGKTKGEALPKRTYTRKQKSG